MNGYRSIQGSIALMCALHILSACDDNEGRGADDKTDTSGETDVDGDTDTDGDTDSDGDADGDLDVDVNTDSDEKTGSDTEENTAEEECTVFPADNPWNRRIDTLPVHSKSDEWVASVGEDGHLHMDFGTVWNGAPNGIPFNVVNSATATYNVDFEWPEESDPGPYPIGNEPSIEGGPDGDGDRHIIMVDWEACLLYELFAAWPPETSGGNWTAGSGAIYDLTSNDLRPDYWTSADAAGLPIFPGLVRYEEVEQGRIAHALRFTANSTQKAFIHPATHFASSITGENVPPMGARFRLKADFDVSGFSASMQVILTAMKEYGMYLADNGSDWYISGAPNSNWSDDELHEAHSILGSAFEVVETGDALIY